MRSLCRKLLLKQISWLRLHGQYRIRGKFDYETPMKTGHSHQRSSKNELINDLFAFQLGSVANIFHKPRRLITLSRDTRYDKYKSLFIQKFKSIMPDTFVASLRYTPILLLHLLHLILFV